LIKNLDPEQCKNLKKFYSNPRKFDLLKRKGVHQYDYVDSVDKLAETALPPKEAFYSRLNDEETTNEDYEHAETVWKESRIKTLEEYTALYNKVDVLQLADAFKILGISVRKTINWTPLGIILRQVSLGVLC